MWARHLELWTPRLAEEWAFAEERQVLINEVRRQRAGLDELPFNNRITFGDDRASGRFIEAVRFERRQSTMWTSSSFASLRFRPGALEGPLSLHLEFAVHLPAADFALEVTLLCNGAEIACWTESGFSGWVERAQTFRLPRESLSSNDDVACISVQTDRRRGALGCAGILYSCNDIFGSSRAELVLR